MASRRLEGWLFDIDELGPEVALWVYAAGGRLLRLTAPFQPPVYVSGERARLKRLAAELIGRGLIAHVRWRPMREFWSGEVIDTLALYVGDSSDLPRLRREAAARDREFGWYNLDIPTAQYYLYLSGLFPLCRLWCEIDGYGRVEEVGALDSPWDDYRLPDLRLLRMRGEGCRPATADSRVVLECAGQKARLRLGDGAAALDAFNDFIERHDPDVILSEQGDGVLMPLLLELARRERRALNLDRDRVVTDRKIVTEGRTYFSYGRIVYKGPSYPLFGRWHIDAKNSFLHEATGLDGLVELARLAKVPVQRMARTSPGSAMSSMQMDRAVQDGLLVPWRKSEPEQYKTARELLTVDKGGLVFTPPAGVHERVYEIDFASMYPTIMVRYNVSPETVLCACCDNRAVPEAGYNVCEKREGLIPRTLRPVLERRRRFKQRMSRADAAARRRYDLRQTAIKWMLVSCFGYLGYKNARFGRIEAHEAVTAYGRELLLRAKERAEAAGFRVLHALTDSLWMKRDGATPADVLRLCDEISSACGVRMSLEGLYRWICFLPSKVKEGRSVPARYYGVFEDGRVKLRGLACRRRDTPAFIRETQLELLEIVARAQTAAERPAYIEEARRLLQVRLNELARGAVDPQRLLVRRALSKGIDSYRVETRTAAAARQLRNAGVRIHPGESLRFLIADAGAKEPAARVRAEGAGGAYDAEAYARLLRAAGEEVFLR